MLDGDFLQQASTYALQHPSIYTSFLIKAINESDVSKIEELGYALTGEKQAVGHIIGLGSPSSKGSLWAKVLDEIFDYLCTNSQKYKDERSKGANSFQSLVGVISASIGASVNIGIGILSGLVAVGLVLVSKIGKNAWCELHKSKA